MEYDDKTIESKVLEALRKMDGWRISKYKCSGDKLFTLKIRKDKEARDKQRAEAEVCEHCSGLIKIRNPMGCCDHLHYPDYCSVCSKRIRGCQ